MASSPTQAPKQSAVFSYFSPQPYHETGKAYEILPEAQSIYPASHPPSNLIFEDRLCDIEDIRGKEREFELDVHGFSFLKHVSKAGNLRDKRQIEGRYLKEVEELIKGMLGEEAKKVYIFSWKVRSSAQLTGAMNDEGGLKVSQPTLHPHVDQSAAGALRRVHHHLSDKAEELLKGRFRILNIWRPLSTVTAYPLALCDTRSVEAGDLVPKDQIGKTFTGESYLAIFNAGHKWCFLGGMERDEVVAMKIYDSEEGVARCCLHSSFSLEEKEWESVRESIEVRAMIFDCALAGEGGEGKVGD